MTTINTETTDVAIPVAVDAFDELRATVFDICSAHESSEKRAMRCQLCRRDARPCYRCDAMITPMHFRAFCTIPLDDRGETLQADLYCVTFSGLATYDCDAHLSRMLEPTLLCLEMAGWMWMEEPVEIPRARRRAPAFRHFLVRKTTHLTPSRLAPAHRRIPTP